MSIDAIRRRLVSDLEGVAGVARVYKDAPDIAPAGADCPAFLLNWREPACIARSATNSSVEYTWQFDIKFLYAPEGVGRVEDNLGALEDFVKLFVDQMYSNFGGGGTWTLLNKDDGTMQFEIGIVTYHSGAAEHRYWGYGVTLNITEYVTTTMSAGT